MKKLLLIPILFLLLNCEVKVKNSNAQSGDFFISYTKEIININNMDYLFVYNKTTTGKSIYVINLTKDKLEVQLLKQQLDKL